jgi:hypothetical protein
MRGDPLRFWYQSLTDLGALPSYQTTITERLRALAPEGAELELFGLREGTYPGGSPGTVQRYPYGFTVALRQVLDYGFDADDRGYDVFVIGSFVAPYLREARSALSIPVTSMIESCLVTALTLAERTTLICLNPYHARVVGAFVASCGLSDRFVIVPLPGTLLERDLSNAFEDPDKVLSAYHEAAREGIAAGGDLIVSAEGILNEVLRKNEIKDVDGSPTMDIVAVTVQHAWMMGQLRKQTGLRPGSPFSYPRPDPELLAQLRAAF